MVHHVGKQFGISSKNEAIAIKLGNLTMGSIQEN